MKNYVALSLVSSNGLHVVIDGMYPRAILDAFSNVDNPLIRDHMYHLSRFFKDLKRIKFLFSHSVPIDSLEPIDILILLDIPSKKRLLAFKHLKYSKLVILEAENPILLSQASKNLNPSLLISPFNKSAHIHTSTAYVYNEIPSLTPHVCKSSEVNTTLIARNLVGTSNLLYNFRRHVVNTFALLGPEIFSHYGYGWQASDFQVITKTVVQKLRALSPSKAFQILHQSTKYNKVNLDCYKGSLESKEILLGYSTILAIENTIDVPGYTTEKPLEPLIYGCLPIYVGTYSSNYLSDFIPIFNSSSLSLMAEFQKCRAETPRFLEEQAVEIRRALNCGFSSGELKTNLSSLFDYLGSLA